MALLAIFAFPSCSDELDTNPTDKVPYDMLFKDGENAQTAINGIYRSLYTAGWGSGWTHENPGLMTIPIMCSAWGEDLVIKESGSGWFYYDYTLQIAGDYIHKSGHSYHMWNMNYTIINNSNEIIGSEKRLTDPLGQNVVAQAKALRAFAYFNLIQLYQQTYDGNQDKPGVPVYTEPVSIKSEGKPRGTVKDVYTQINKDLDEAISMFEKLGRKNQVDPSHIDYYVAQGFKARVALVMHDFEKAEIAAQAALSNPSKKLATMKELGHFNKVDAPSVLWGSKILKDQSLTILSIFGHFDASNSKGFYAEKSRKLISTGLYNQISGTDLRKSGKESWWNGVLPEDAALGDQVSYCQEKFKFDNPSDQTGDYIYMRMEEMLLILSEAQCQLGKFGDAKANLKKLMDLRDPKAQDVLSKLSDSKEYSKDTNQIPTTLMEEILLQRRIELWCEIPRIWDLQRLHLGYNRSYSGSNHRVKVDASNTNAAAPNFILPIPMEEFNGNKSMDPGKDQNPIVQL